MAKVTISRSYELQCSHFLPNVPEGHKCRNMHGHTWDVEVCVTGEMDPRKGWFLDFADIDIIWMEHVHEVVDHSIMNDTIVNPTTENICLWIAEQLRPHLLDGKLSRITARENRHSCVTLDF